MIASRSIADVVPTIFGDGPPGSDEIVNYVTAETPMQAPRALASSQSNAGVRLHATPGIISLACPGRTAETDTR